MDHSAKITLILLLAISPARAEAGWLEQAARWSSPELRRLDRAQRKVETSLARLPAAPSRNLTERLGFHSGYSSAPDTINWVEFDFGQAEAIDAIVIVGAASNSGGAAPPGYGFPVRFRVDLIGEPQRPDVSDRVTLADFTTKDFPNPGALPVYLSAQGKKARTVRITATRLFRDDDGYLLALGEVMIFKGKRNLVADLPLRGPRKIEANGSRGVMPVWGKINLGDGHSVLGPPVGDHVSPTLGFQSESLPEPTTAKNADPSLAANKWVQIDLRETTSIQEVRLFPAHPPKFAHRQGYLFPPRFKLEVSDSPDFEAARLLASFDKSSVPNPGDNVMAFSGEDRSGRYVRLTALELSNSTAQFRFALAEMQVWSGGENVALGKTVTASDSVEADGWSTAALVDGFNSRANIVDWASWLEGLSQRRELTLQLAELSRRRAVALEGLATAGIRTAVGLAITFLFGVLFIVWKQRWQRRRELDALRQRISQDLHDEVGSSLGTIALISHGLLTTAHDPAQMRQSLEEIQSISRQTVDSMRDITRLVQSDAYGQGDLSLHLREIAARMLRNVPHNLQLDVHGFPPHIPVDRQRDLVLMFTEALHNILRHADATLVTITLAGADGRMVLTVQDNGRGFRPDEVKSSGMGLTNIRRRAEKFGGEMCLTSTPCQGTTLAIALPLR